MKKIINIVWVISLIVVGIATVILNGSNIIGIDLSDWFSRLLGIIDLVAVLTLIFTTTIKVVKKL